MAEEESDSVTHTRKRRAQIREESDRIEQEMAAAEAERAEKQTARDLKSREAESQFLTQQAGLIQEGETRDHLLQRIREMREIVPPGPPPPPPMSDYQKEQLRIEQEAGAAGVKRAEEAQAAAAEHRKKVEAERLAREGTMTEVHHPNPGQNEQFPSQNATLGKRR